MAESARRGRDAAHPAVETLEGRTVLSVSASLASAGGIPLNPTHYYVTPQSGEVDLIVTRPSRQAGAASVFTVEATGSYVQQVKPGARMPRMGGNILSIGSVGPDRIVMRRVRTTGPHRSTLPFVPIDGTYRFAPGQTSLTIPIRLNPRFIPHNGSIQVAVSIQDSPANIFILPSATAGLNIGSSLDQIPPKVVGSSRAPGAITLTFSKPMNPATVEDVTNYEVHGNIDPGWQTVPLKSAVYDPATQTVTLTPTEPLTEAGYAVRFMSAAKSPTDLQGNAAVFNDLGFNTIFL